MIGIKKDYSALAAIQVDEQYCRLDFLTPLNCISNAPWHGGTISSASGILNLKVPANKSSDSVEPLKETFERNLQNQKLANRYIGLMTAASMKSFRVTQGKLKHYSLLCAVTAGLANARRVGDAADYLELTETTLEPGTINIMFATNAPLTPSAQQEAFALITEAKTAACYDSSILSVKSKKAATGTGTDATVVASLPCIEPDKAIPYCGKHTLLGEHIGRLAYDTASNAIQGCLDSL